MEKSKNERISSLIELIIVVLLGITAVATAWASWQGALHGSQQDQKYTEATKITAEANSMYNEGTQYMSQDMGIWNQLIGLNIDLTFAENKNETEEVEKLNWKIEQIMNDNVSEEFAKAIEWAGNQAEHTSPFENEEFISTYFKDSNAKFEEAEEMMARGNENNTHGDNQGLVTVIYAVVLFLLGIAATFKKNSTKMIIIAMSLVGFIAATSIMLAIPIVLP